MVINSVLCFEDRIKILKYEEIKSMADIGLTYFIVIIIAWYCQYKRQDEVKNLALVIVNRMLFIPFLGFGILLLLRFLHQNSPGVDLLGKMHLVTNIQLLVNSFFLFISVFLLIPSVTKNIKTSTNIGILLLLQFLAIFFPQFSLERLMYLLIYDDYIPSFFLANGIESFMKNFMFFSLWFIFFFFMKMGIKSKSKLK